jgi:aspartyl-tRNA(Asn)/glutamyl-tRNA(Gln) amidotransferase subunit B
MAYETVIGLEVHAQLKTRTKIWCGCPTTFGAPPNTQVCPICLGLPGVLPVLNRRVVEFAMKVGLPLHCGIAEASRFARKNYFYPDMPKNYQISQYELPICVRGWLEVDGRKIGITRVHMEEDVGKLSHEWPGEEGPYSYVDFNRAGVPLLEIVSEPDLRSPEEAAAYLRKLRALLRYLDVSDANMEEGNFRCDANVSVRPAGTTAFGTKVEIKNLNSFRFVQQALEYEVRRQAAALDTGERIVQETRLYDPDRGVTQSMRTKESAHDYRYFPDPDLLPLEVSREWVDEVRRSLPELPDEKRDRFVRDYGLPAYDAGVLTASRGLADYFERAAQAYAAASDGAAADRSSARRRATGSWGSCSASSRRRGATRATWPTRRPSRSRPSGSRPSSCSSSGARSTGTRPRRSSRKCTRAARRRRRSSGPAASRRCPTRAPSRPRSATSSPPTPTRWPPTGAGRRSSSASSSGR